MCPVNHINKHTLTPIQHFAQLDHVVTLQGSFKVTTSLVTICNFVYPRYPQSPDFVFYNGELAILPIPEWTISLASGHRVDKYTHRSGQFFKNNPCAFQLVSFNHIFPVFSRHYLCIFLSFFLIEFLFEFLTTVTAGNFEQENK